MLNNIKELLKEDINPIDNRPTETIIDELLLEEGCIENIDLDIDHLLNEEILNESLFNKNKILTISMNIFNDKKKELVKSIIDKEFNGKSSNCKVVLNEKELEMLKSTYLNEKLDGHKRKMETIDNLTIIYSIDGNNVILNKNMVFLFRYPKNFDPNQTLTYRSFYKYAKKLY